MTTALAMHTGGTKRATRTMSGHKLYGKGHDNKVSYGHSRYRKGHNDNVRTQTVWLGTRQP